MGAPDLMARVLPGERHRKQRRPMSTETEEEVTGPWRQRGEGCGHKSENAGGRDELKETKNWFFPRASGQSTVPSAK